MPQRCPNCSYNIGNFTAKGEITVARCPQCKWGVEATKLRRSPNGAGDSQVPTTEAPRLTDSTAPSRIVGGRLRGNEGRNKVGTDKS